ncbi:MAG: hypothetical protein AB8G95_30595 [Anaerolineae bacterium]
MKRLMLSIMLVCLFCLAACGPSAEELIEKYETAVSLAADGSCAEAELLFDEIVDSESDVTRDGDDSSLVSLSRTGRSACSALALTESDIAADPPNSLTRLVSAANYFEGTSQLDEVEAMIGDMWVEYGVEALATRGNCPNWRGIVNRLPDSDTSAPVFLQQCGDDLSARSPGSLQARNYYRKLLENYAAAPNRAAVEASLAAETINYVNNEPDQFLFFPQPEGVTEGVSIGGDKAVISIANGTEDKINLVLAGLETVVESVEGCAECEGATSCSGNEPFVTFEVDPGSYQIVLESGSIENEVAMLTGFGDINPSVQPYAGSWDLEAGTAYPMCFFLTTVE